MNILKKYKLLIGVGIIFLLILPIIISQVIRIKTGDWTIGSEDAWIGFLGGYIGALSGGIVSGLLTLGGVYLTIQHERKIRVADSFPLKRKYATEVIIELEQFENTFSSYFKPHLLEDGEFTFELRDEDKEQFDLFVKKGNDLLNSATMVNSVFFSITRKIIFCLEEIQRLNSTTPFHRYHSLEIELSKGEYAKRIVGFIEEAKLEARKIDDILEEV